MDPFTELSNLRYSGKTDGRRHLAKFEKLMSQTYPGASDSAKWTLFTKTFDTANPYSKSGETPGSWLISLSKTEQWQTGRLTYPHLKAIFLDRWSKVQRDSPPPPQGYRMLESPGPSTQQLVTQDGIRTKIELDSSAAKKNQVVLTFPDLKKRKKTAEPLQITHHQQQQQQQQLHHHHRSSMPMDAPPSPMSGSMLVDEEDKLRHNDVIVVVNEQRPSDDASVDTRPRLLEGKICAITGASEGIGRAIALGMAKEGAQIVAHYWGSAGSSANDDIVSLCVEIRSLGQGCSILFGDISDPRTSENIVKKAVEAYGRLDVVVANAGICWTGNFLDMTPEHLLRHNDVNLNGNFFLCQAAARQMSTQASQAKPEDAKPDYSIICISSPNVYAGSGQRMPVYSTKSGLRSLMQTCAISLGGFGIRCNNVSPGTIQGNSDGNTVSFDAMDNKRMFERSIPLKRIGQPEDVVGPVVFLASQMAKYITGTEITVDGGAFINNVV